MIEVSRLVRLAARGQARVARASFWNDRRAVRLKMLLIGACLIGAALFEGPW